MNEFNPQVGQRVEVPNPDGESWQDQMLKGTITSISGAYFTVRLDNGVLSPYAWVVEDGVRLLEDRIRDQQG